MNNKLINNQVEWLGSLISKNGEFIINNHPSDNAYKIVPYFSNIAGIALVMSGQTPLIKKYLGWYICHLNNPDKFGSVGTIYDYFLKTNGELISTFDYDSYDSYPATFLWLCKEYFDVTKDYLFFKINKKFIDDITNSLISTMDTDNLTWAKPNWRLKYTMDNCEVYKGLFKGSKLYENVYNDSDTGSKLLGLAIKSKSSIENILYDNNKGYYYSYINESGHKEIPDIKKWYPDASCQLFPIIYGVVDAESDKAKMIYDIFNNNFPNWPSVPIDDFPNMFLGYTACLMKDFDRAKEFLKMSEKYIKNDNKWPWYNVESSYYIRTFNELLQNKSS